MIIFTNSSIQIFQTTDKISEAHSVRDNNFAEKLNKIAKIDQLSTESQAVIENKETIEKLQEGNFVKLTGKRDDSLVNVLVQFDKDKMTVEVAPSTEFKKAERYEYIPK